MCVRKNATCYWCYALDRNPVTNYPTCLLGETQDINESEQFKGWSIYKAKPTRVNCRPKTVKEYCIRAEEYLLRCSNGGKGLVNK